MTDYTNAYQSMAIANTPTDIAWSSYADYSYTPWTANPWPSLILPFVAQPGAAADASVKGQLWPR